MTTKTIFIFGLTFLLFSCGQHTHKNENQSRKTAFDTIIDSTNFTTIDQTDQNSSPYQIELVKALNDPTIDNYYKEIYRKEKLISAADNKMLSITDSLFTNNPDRDLFFFVVFTKSMNGSDGFYAEALGYSAFEFVTKKTLQFAEYFNSTPKLTDQDMNNWAKYVYGEIQISRENQELKAVKELERQLLENIKGARKENKVVIDRFIKKIKSTMP